MATNFTLKIVSPDGVIAERVVDAVQLPLVDGEIGVLPNHCAYTGQLKAGMIRAGSESYEIRGGFARFADNVLTVLAD
jgi:F-type H+-transporting ATPase subunit epsilon